MVPREEHAIRELPRHLAQALGVDVSEVSVLPAPREIDLLLQVGSKVFLVEWKREGKAEMVWNALAQLSRYAALVRRKVIPLVAVPFMGDTGRDLCAKAGVGWMDLSGNAQIDAPGLRLQIRGQANRFRRPGRPSSAFAPRASRVVRQLLADPLRPLSQQEIVTATGIDRGYVSRVVARLLELGTIRRDKDRRLVVQEPRILFEAWREDYAFLKHQVLLAHVPFATGEQTVEEVHHALKKASIEHAFTGLAAAWLFTRFAAFRTTTVYLRNVARFDWEKALQPIGYREVASGGNLWVVVPNDEGVFLGVVEVAGIPCVSHIQTLLDLDQQPERAKEAAAELRRRFMKWAPDA